MIKAVLFDYDGVMTPDKTGSFTQIELGMKTIFYDHEKNDSEKLKSELIRLGLTGLS